MSYLSHEWRFFVQAPWHQFFSQCPWHLCSTSSCTHNFGELCFSYAFSFSATLLDAQFYFFLQMLLAHIPISIFLAQHCSFLWFSQNICCLSMQINYHGDDYLTLIDSYCSAMLLEQLVWSSGYVMLLQFTGTGEAPERIYS